MASQNEVPPKPRADDPINTAKDLLVIVKKLQMTVHKPVSVPSRVSRIVDEEPLRKIPLCLPPDGDLFSRLSHHLQLIKIRLVKLEDLRGDVHYELSRHYISLHKFFKKVEKSSLHYGFLTNEMKKYLVDITNKISDLVGKLSMLPDKPAREKAFSSQKDYGHNNRRAIVILPGLQENEEDLTRLVAFRQVKQRFMELGIERKMCLLSFAVFPENREVHRTVLMYWWIGEGILPVDGAEETVRDVLKDFTDKNLVEPVLDRRKVAPSSYKMTPFVHSSVIHLSKEIGIFDIYHKGEKPRMRLSDLGKVCLVEGSSQQGEAHGKYMPTQYIETVFNVSESYPEFTFKWFSEHPSDRKLIKISKTLFKSLHVFYLGRWERTQKRHIQVRNPELMKYLKATKNLRLVSFQGISTIRILKSSICKLHKLIVLDLRECSDLTKLPENIGSLHCLVYLDMTGCYMLEWIPMRLALLNNLEVLKGFVVSNIMYEGVACTLSLLKRLKKLRKLSIEIHRDDLGVHQLMQDIVKLKAVTSLKVTWRRDLNIIRSGKQDDDSSKIKALPDQLKKLDLQRYPHEQLPTWLQPHNLRHLKKFHIGGGRTFKGFGDLPGKATQCAVQVLRLTSLPKLRVGWIDLKQLYFPNMILFENYDCPRVSLTPCDGIGIWRSDQDDY